MKIFQTAKHLVAKNSFLCRLLIFLVFFAGAIWRRKIASTFFYSLDTSQWSASILAHDVAHVSSFLWVQFLSLLPEYSLSYLFPTLLLASAILLLASLLSRGNPKLDRFSITKYFESYRKVFFAILFMGTLSLLLLLRPARCG